MAETTLAERIQMRLEALDLSARRASLNAGLSPHFLKNVLSGRGTSFSTDNLIKIAESLKTTPEWLLTGRTPDQGPAEAAELVEIYLQMNEADRQSLIDFAKWKLSGGG